MASIYRKSKGAELCLPVCRHHTDIDTKTPLLETVLEVLRKLLGRLERIAPGVFVIVRVTLDEERHPTQAAALEKLVHAVGVDDFLKFDRSKLALVRWPIHQVFYVELQGGALQASAGLHQGHVAVDWTIFFPAEKVEGREEQLADFFVRLGLVEPLGEPGKGFAGIHRDAVDSDEGVRCFGTDLLGRTEQSMGEEARSVLLVVGAVSNIYIFVFLEDEPITTSVTTSRY